MKILSLLPICAAVVCCAASLSAQVGGEFEAPSQYLGHDASDYFGTSVSSAGDLNGDGIGDFMIGAPRADVGPFNDAGKVYFYSGADGSETSLNGVGSGSLFGWSIAALGDITGDGFGEVLIGAYASDAGGASSTGAAFVFSPPNTTPLYSWTGSAANENFGQSVSAAGDVNGDGIMDILIGAPGAHLIGGGDPGSAFVYSGANGAFLRRINGSTSGDKFGYSVSGGGDLNGDGFGDLIVGQPSYSSSQGAVHAYSGATGSLLWQKTGANTGDSLGFSVSNAGDVNADGFDDVIAGTPSPANGALTGAGFAIVYSGATGAEIHHWFGNKGWDGLGVSVAGAGDVDGDGFDDLIVGASGYDIFGVSNAAPSAYLYSGRDGNRMQNWHEGVNDDGFGISVASAGDIDGDGLPEVLVGSATYTSGGITTRGAAYLFSFDPFMHLDRTSVSATAGGVVNFDLHFPIATAGNQYKILISATGIGPTLFGIEVPLTQDALVVDTFFGNYPVPVYSNLHGTLDGQAKATASITVPAGIPPVLVGQTYYVAAITMPGGLFPTHSSSVTAVEITP